MDFNTLHRQTMNEILNENLLKIKTQIEMEKIDIPTTKFTPKLVKKVEEKPKEEEKWVSTFEVKEEFAAVGGWNVHTGHLYVHNEQGRKYSCNLSGYASNCSILVVSDMFANRSQAVTEEDSFKHLINLIEKDELRRIHDDEDYDEDGGDEGIRSIINRVPSIIEYTSTKDSTTKGAIAAGFIPVYSYRNYNSGNTVTKLIYAADMSYVDRVYNRNYLNFTITNQK